MKSLVTGAGGFLGRRLVSRLLQSGIDAHCLMRPGANIRPLLSISPDNTTGKLTVVYGTLGALKGNTELLEGCDTIFHLAASLTGSTASLFLNNVVGTHELLELSAKSGVRRVVLISSMGVYSGEQLRRGQVIDESMPIDAQPHLRDPYTYSKVAQEREANRIAKERGINLVTIRPGVIYGPGRDVITSRVGLKLGSVLLRMGGRRQLPYTFVDNCADAIFLAGKVSGIDGETFNIIDDDPPTPGQLLRRYRKSVGPIRTLRIPHFAIAPLSRTCQWYHRYSDGQLPAIFTPYKSRAMWSNVRYSNARAKRLLGWQPKVTFPDGLSQTFMSWKNPPMSNN